MNESDDPLKVVLNSIQSREAELEEAWLEHQRQRGANVIPNVDPPTAATQESTKDSGSTPTGPWKSIHERHHVKVWKLPYDSSDLSFYRSSTIETVQRQEPARQSHEVDTALGSHASLGQHGVADMEIDEMQDMCWCKKGTIKSVGRT